MSATKTMWIAVAVAAGMVASLASVAQAGVVYSDNFTDGATGALSGQAPLVAPGDEEWAAASGFNKNTEDGFCSIGNGAAWLSMTFTEETFPRDAVYTVTGTLTNTTDGNNWVGIGWTTGSTGAWGGRQSGQILDLLARQWSAQGQQARCHLRRRRGNFCVRRRQHARYASRDR